MLSFSGGIFITAISQPALLDNYDDVKESVVMPTSQRDVTMTTLEKARKRTPLGRFVMKIGRILCSSFMSRYTVHVHAKYSQ